ncbi:MAG: IS21 family transposase [Bacteroidetes bacterium]|nr:IS21 family transposase [Bacteroidota bacterium]
MQDIRALLRFYYEEQQSKRAIARYLRISQDTVRKYLLRAESAGLSWPLPEQLTDEDLEALLFPDSASARPQPDWPAVEKALSGKGMTLDLIWQDWHAEHPTGYSYGHFCACYKKWCKAQKITMRLEHKAGEKLYVDFAGKTVEILDPVTGDLWNAQVFVAAMGGSHYTYVEVVPDQSTRSWIDAHVRCLEFLGALPKVIVCDNLKAAVIRARRKNPKLNASYKDFARHYDLKIEPARVQHPQDKAVAESSVKHITTHILTKLDRRQFFSLYEVNQELRPLLEQINRRPFQNREGSRFLQFEERDRPVMRPLPALPYEFREWKKLKVNLNYHVQVHGGYYSVPYRYAHQSLDLRSCGGLLFSKQGGGPTRAHSNQGGLPYNREPHACETSVVQRPGAPVERGPRRGTPHGDAGAGGLGTADASGAKFFVCQGDSGLTATV